MREPEAPRGDDVAVHFAGSLGDRLARGGGYLFRTDACPGESWKSIWTPAWFGFGSAARLAAWTYEILDEAPVGRQKNELLAFGYMISTLKHFGAGAPLRVTLPRKPLERAALEDLLGCEITTGEKAALVFRAECLCNANPACVDADDARIDDMPSPTDFSAAVERLIELALLERRPTIDAVRRRLALSARGLQRRLAEEGESFDAIRRRVVLAKARTCLRDGATPITQIAYELGYADAAHFSRAFAAWTGESPRAWRRAALAR